MVIHCVLMLILQELASNGCRLSQEFYYPRSVVLVRTSYGTVSVSVRYKLVFYQNRRTDRAGFCLGGFLQPILQCIITKLRYLPI